MNDFIYMLELFLQTAVQMGTPILFATLGGILCEKVGNLNLGIEGMMLMGAVVGFITAVNTSNPLLAIIFAGLFAAVGALIYAFITVTLRGNQVVTGLVLTIFGSGISSFLGQKFVGVSLPEKITSSFKTFEIPILSDIPIIGKMFFSQSAYVYLSLVFAILLHFYLNKTSIGLNLRSVGENPSAADASGVSVIKYKYLNILTGGFLCGVGGAFLPLVYVPRWMENITAGIGWIAVALVIFSTWSPLKAIFGAYLFGALRGIGFKVQNVDFTFLGSKFKISPQLLDMIPYIVTILVLVIISIRKRKENQPPQALGLPYFREDR